MNKLLLCSYRGVYGQGVPMSSRKYKEGGGGGGGRGVKLSKGSEPQGVLRLSQIS